jgi:hypothetical protein
VRLRSGRNRQIGRGHLAVIVLCAPLAGGASCSQDSPLKYPHIQAAGRPANCPDRPMTNPNGIASPDAIRCSYDDGVGAGSARLTGSVYGEGQSAMSDVALEGVSITVHKIKGASSPGDIVGRATSDPQGRYSMSAMLPEGEYLVIARDAEGNELARAPLRTRKGSDSDFKVDLLVPLDPAIREAMRTFCGETATTETEGGEKEVASPTQTTATPEQKEAMPPAGALSLTPRTAEGSEEETSEQK